MVPDRLGADLSRSYRIERELGQGGMATVYLAQDLRHDRKVALKVLRPELSAILGVQRFLAEIKTTANLQHPHILSLFDSGEADGLAYYVMPYVEGESLRDRLNREKQLPVEDALRIAREVLDALEYAHAKGIIHRDIKPENILLHGGHALVADFGIALAASRSNDATRMTETGMSLGTPYYMAPEQAMGERDITARADIYALGAVLYEMLVAEPPFQGPTAQAIIARVMTEEPRSLTLQRRTIPPHIEAAVLTALAKLPADRFATAGQFLQALGNPGFASTGTMPRAAYVPARTRRARVLAVLPWVLVACLGGVLAWNRFRVHPPTPPPLLRMGLELPPNALWEDQSGSGMDLSPDGTNLVYHGRDSSGLRLFLRPMDQPNPIPLAGTTNATMPVFSPDGRWISFRQGNKINRVPLAGGTPETLCTIKEGEVGTYAWFDDHSLIMADRSGLRLCSIDGSYTDLYHPDSLDQLVWPRGLPDGRGVIYAINQGGNFQLGLYDAKRREGRSLGIVGSNPRYIPPGYLVYGTLDGVLKAVPFDLGRMEVTGEPVIVMQGVRVGGGGAAKFGIADNGTIVTAVGLASERTLELVDRRGAVQPLSLPMKSYGTPRFSPDDRQIATSIGDVVSSNIWLFDRRQGTLTRLTFDTAASRPSWSPDGRLIAYASALGTEIDLRIIRSDGSTAAESLLAVAGLQLFQAEFTPDGRSMVVRSTVSGRRDIWITPLDSTRALQPLLTSPADERGPTLSPDGRWMAYSSDESGRMEVYVRAFPGMGARYQISLDGGMEPVWSPRGDEIFYRNGAAMLVAAVRTAPEFDVTGRTTLFSNSDFILGGYEPFYDVTRDGQLLVMVRSNNRNTGLRVMVNWFDQVRAGRSADATREISR